MSRKDTVGARILTTSRQLAGGRGRGQMVQVQLGAARGATGGEVPGVLRSGMHRSAL